jgi:hypothetical protein
MADYGEGAGVIARCVEFVDHAWNSNGGDHVMTMGRLTAALRIVTIAFTLAVSCAVAPVSAQQADDSNAILKWPPEITAARWPKHR